MPDRAKLDNEVASYAAIGLLGGVVPDIAPFVDRDLLDEFYTDDGTVIWPAES